MSLLSGNKKDGKKGNKNTKNALPGAKQNIKPGSKAASFARKPVKTGGTRGS
jgi:hypothetical protein